MKTVKHYGVLSFIFSILAFTHSALASVQFTYTSIDLPFIQGYLNGIPDESVGSSDYPFGFSATFTATGNNPATLLSGTFIETDFPDYIHNISLIDSYIGLDTSGSVNDWHFSFSAVQNGFQSDGNPIHDTWFISSAHGTNTCNCDFIKNESDIFLRRHESWQYISTLGFEFQGDNNQGNWANNAIGIPEPMNYLLLLSGLLSIGLIRLRKNASTMC